MSQTSRAGLLKWWRCPVRAPVDTETARMIGTMNERRSTRVTRADVRAALMWALERDREALLAHRDAVHSSKSDLTRRRADKALVEQWRARTADAEQDTSRPE